MRWVTWCLSPAVCVGIAANAWPLEFRETAPDVDRHASGLEELLVATNSSKRVFPGVPPLIRASSSPGDDPMKQFLATVLAETEDTWAGIFKANGLTYEDPKLVLFSGSVRSTCEDVSAPNGIFYCPEDHKIYLDVIRFQKVSEIGVKSEIGYAFLLAREVGHHVQNLTGILPKFHQMRRQMNEADASRLSVRVELQADCFAGIWGHYMEQKGILDPGDLEEALFAFHELGDDTMQLKMLGSPQPDSLHGTSKQRRIWFQRGFDTGNLSACDTFNDPDPAKN
ncbi:flagellar biosynthesis protein FlgM [Mesorhizobium sp. B2-4-17]|nr:flagellar biosynthesis protein FlgM [Mesorhizobium sp. B2-4-17]